MGTDRIYGYCPCGMWHSLFDTVFYKAKNARCWSCGNAIRIWYEIKKVSIWWKPWTWGRKLVVCNGYGNGWASVPLPKQLWGKT